MRYFPSDISDAMSICALRFDGYKYEEVAGLSAPDSTGAGLGRLIEQIVKERTLYADDNRNFAAFFGLQRYLHKWGGEALTKSSDEHIAYDFLFLHLYQSDVPDDFRVAEYCIQWQREFAERAEETAAFVRRSFQRNDLKERINNGMFQDQTPSNTMTEYKKGLVKRYWGYQQRFFPQLEAYFDQPLVSDDGRPPVFRATEAWRNVIVNPHADQPEIDKLLALVPDRHKWFRSMNSSQALALSVLGNLSNAGNLNCLVDVEDDEGEPLLGKVLLANGSFAMEHRIKHLGEPRSTSLDGYIGGNYRVAFECKYTETDVGSCSRPRLTPTDAKYESEHCDGTYTRQRMRRERCALSEIGVLYWQYVPQLFNWQGDRELNPCPLSKNYQLVRNILAVGVAEDGKVSFDNGHVVLLYDERNPANLAGGNCLAAYRATRAALKEPTMLRKCSWQRIVRQIRENRVLPWLTEHLSLKYGL
jgi:hypothetical protein